MEGKLHETKSLSNSTARATDLTNITTCYALSKMVMENDSFPAHLIELKGVQQLV